MNTQSDKQTTKPWYQSSGMLANGAGGLMGVVGSLMALFVIFGVLTAEQAASIKNELPNIMAGFGGIYTVISIIGWRGRKNATTQIKRDDNS